MSGKSQDTGPAKVSEHVEGYTQTRKSLQCMLGELKHHLTASPRPLSRQRPCKTSILNVTAAFKKTSALLSLKIIRCYFAVERWLSGSHMSGKALMLRKIPNKFLNQNSPHKLGGVTEKVIKPAQTRDSQRYSWAALAYFSTVQAKQQQASSSRQSSSRQAAAGKSSAGKAATGK